MVNTCSRYKSAECMSLVNLINVMLIWKPGSRNYMFTTFKCRMLEGGKYVFSIFIVTSLWLLAQSCPECHLKKYIDSRLLLLSIILQVCIECTHQRNNWSLPEGSMRNRCVWQLSKGSWGQIKDYDCFM